MRKRLDKWLDEYFAARPQIKRPDKNLWGEYVMPPNVRHAFNAMAAENEELQERLAMAEMVAGNAGT